MVCEEADEYAGVFLTGRGGVWYSFRGKKACCMDSILREGFAELGVPASEASISALKQYYSLLDERNQVMNLTAIKGEEDTARLHFLDCGALLAHVPLAGKRLADIGAGAGFPGLVLKILEPRMELTMIDSLQKRVTFQQEVVDALSLAGVTCLAGRAEEQSALRGGFDVVTSRAVARLSMLAELCLPLVKRGGVFVAMKGPDPEEEVKEAARGLALLGGHETKIVKYTVPGTDAVHSLVIVKKTAPTPPQYPRAFAKIKKQPL